MPITIAVADDHPIVLQGLISLIEADGGFRVVSRSADGLAALAAIRAGEPDLAMIDLNMPGLNGRQVLAAAVGEGLKTRIVLLTAAATDAEIYDTIDAGAAGVVIKDTGIDTLLTCLKTVAAGGQWLPEEVVGPALGREASRRDEWRDLSASLTSRELEIIRLVTAGASTKEISYRLDITLGTAKVHLSNIFRKMKVSTRAELLRLAEGQI